MWAVWGCRNKAVFKEYIPDVPSVVQGLLNFVHGWMDHNAKIMPEGTAMSVIPSSSCWLKPPYGWVKVNTDAHLNDQGFVGVGAVIRDDAGRILAAAVRRWKGSWKVDVAEASAVRFGVLLAARLGFSKVCLECDCLSIISRLVKGVDGFSYVSLFLDDVLQLQASFSDFKIAHVKRGGNCLAHYVARKDVEWGVERVWCDPIPQDICNVASYDLI